LSQRTDELCLYKDKSKNNSFTVEQFGEVLNGETVKKTGYVCNNSDSLILQVDYHTEDPDVSIEDLPRVLDPKELQKISVVYSPNQNRKTGLNTSVTISGKKSELVNK